MQMNFGSHFLKNLKIKNNFFFSYFDAVTVVAISVPLAVTNFIT